MPRSITEQESLKLLKTIFKEEDPLFGINWENHRKEEKIDDCYRITLNLLSLDSLLKISNHSKVKRVLFHPSAAATGAAMDGIALRYRLYIQYKKVPALT